MAGQLLFCSGQIPLDPVTGQMIEGDVAAQTRRVLENVRAILVAANATFDDVVKTTVFLADMEDFAAMNAVYAEVLLGARARALDRAGGPSAARRARGD